MTRPWNLDYWKSGEWQVVDEILHDREKAGVRYNPRRADLFRNIASLHCSDVRVCIVGQDPYPQHKYATGHAFSIPPQFGPASFPGTLREIFGELRRDLDIPIPSHGDLSRWVSQGVLLWNVIPTCTDGTSLSDDWDEYEPLNREVFGRLSQKGIVFALLGGVARRYVDVIDPRNNRIIATSHPSPRGSRNSRTPFNGSRLFSEINRHLGDLGLDPIDWRTENVPVSASRESLGNKILPNITGANLGGFPGQKVPGHRESSGDQA